MVSATLGNLLGDEVRRGVERLKNYSIEEIEEIINNGTMEDKRVLSRTFFKSDERSSRETSLKSNLKHLESIVAGSL